MSPRAAWRLESLGFTKVFDYVAGKVDWLANGLPSEGTASKERHAAALARQDVPTCRLTDTVRTARERIEGTDWRVCVVVAEERVVLGLLNAEGLAANPQTPVEEVMESGPSTWRLNGSLADIANYIDRHHVDAITITTSDGKLHGVIRREDIPV